MRTVRYPLPTAHYPLPTFIVSGLSVTAGHLPRRVLNDARRLDGLLNLACRRAELSRRTFTDVMLLYNHIPPRLLISVNHARQHPDQQPRDDDYEEQAHYEWHHKLIPVQPSVHQALVYFENSDQPEETKHRDRPEHAGYSGTWRFGRDGVRGEAQARAAAFTIISLLRVLKTARRAKHMSSI